MIGAIGRPSAHAIAASGIVDGMRRMDDAARRSLEGPDVAAAVDASCATAKVGACVASLRVADEMTGTLIDALA